MAAIHAVDTDNRPPRRREVPPVTAEPLRARSHHCTRVRAASRHPSAETQNRAVKGTMLSIAKLSHGQERYYLEGAGERVDVAEAIGDGLEDYYVDPSEARGRWSGVAAGRLGIAGEVTGDHLRRLLTGTHPVTGAPLRNGTRPLKVAAFDLTFSAPKSVSVVFAVADPHTRDAVRDAHDAAAMEALGYLERSATAVRRGHGGLVVEATDGLVAAAFRHRSSRAGDPQLHTHVVVANLGQGRDGRWTALDGRRLFAHAMTASHVYQAVLRSELSRTLGVRWTPVERGIAEIEGVPAHVRRAFSRRRAEIEDALARSGTSGPRAAEAAALATRRAKNHDVQPAALFAEWRARATQLGFDADSLSLDDRHHQPRPAMLEALLGPAGLTAQASTFSRADVIAAVADAAMPATAVEAELLADHLLRHPDVLPVVASRDDGTQFRRRDGKLLRIADEERRYSTRELIDTERAVLEHAATGRRTGRAAVSADRLDPRLSNEQRAAVMALVTRGDTVAVLAGRAGTGKTFALAAAREAWEAGGHAVLGAAVARRAARELERGAGIPSTSVTGLLSRLDGRPLPRHSVLVVDEAGMLGTRDLARLVEHVSAAEGKLVLVGDHRQLPEIDAGGVFHALVRRGHAAELRENRRQVHRWERVAIDHLRAGRTEQALAIYGAHDRVHLHADSEETRRRLVEDWAEADGDALMIAASRADVADLNRRARDHLREGGQLGDSEVAFGEDRFAVGDRIVIRRNDAQLDVRNGDRGRVVGIDADERQLLVDTEGRRIELGVSFAAQRISGGASPIQHAYAVTCHVAQGATVDHAFVLADGSIGREWGYTALTRGRQANHLHLSADRHQERAEYAPLGRALPDVDPLARLADDLRRADGQRLALDGGRVRDDRRRRSNGRER